MRERERDRQTDRGETDRGERERETLETTSVSYVENGEKEKTRRARDLIKLIN